MRLAVSPISLVGGVSITPSQGFFTVNGKPVVRAGDVVLPHGAHFSAVVVSVGFFTCQGIPVVKETDLASCGDVVINGEFPTLS